MTHSGLPEDWRDPRSWQLEEVLAVHGPLAALFGTASGQAETLNASRAALVRVTTISWEQFIAENTGQAL